jgi:phosphatidylserine/phosphatidylglycerophosphate/cardiolipin synthase-like enzyme
MIVVDAPSAVDAAGPVIAVAAPVEGSAAEAEAAVVLTETLLVPVVLSSAAAVVLASEAAAAVMVQQQHIMETKQGTENAETDDDASDDNNDSSLLKILTSLRVELDDDDIPGSIENLKVLYRALMLHSSSSTGSVGACKNGNARSPGFFTAKEDEAGSSSLTWSRGGTAYACYEMLDLSPLDRFRVPIPSRAFAAQCCALIQGIFGLRLAWKQQGGATTLITNPACSCIGEWDFSGKRHVVLETLTNQAMEQLMIQEASECISQTLLPDAASVEAWNQTYSAEKCTSSTSSNNNNIEMNHHHHRQLLNYNAQTPVKLLRTRDEYIACMVKYCMAAKHTIQISTCYLHSHDPAQRYLLLDVLPYVIRNHGVTVQVLVDLLTIEGAIVKSGFTNATKQPVTAQQQQTLRTKIRPDDDHITVDSFLKHLPTTAPPQSEASRQKIHSPVDFLQQLLQVAAQVEEEQKQTGGGAGGSYQIQWWCARDAQYKYRIKNHCKCTVIDHQVSIIGGSNVAPTLEAATSDLDVLLAGPVAKDVARAMELQWNAMDRTGGCRDRKSTTTTAVATTAASACVSKECPLSEVENTMDAEGSTKNSRVLQELMGEEKWADRDSRVAIICSLPSSRGEDAILRVVLGAIADARQSVVMCMGHCNIPAPMTRAFRDATKRGVSVQVLVNSMYSCDLRGGQRDLFLSLRDLLNLAPEVEVYVTAPCGENNGDSTLFMKGQPPFLHAKYVVFDGRFTAVGSWNVWPRGSFYELEHEALIHSTAIASEILVKFQEEKNATAIRLTPEMCEPGAGFCPTGCAICKGFGPFYQE